MSAVAKEVQDPRGLKRICMECGTRFYDMNKRPIICPSCSAEFSGEVKIKTRRGRSAAVEEAAGQVTEAEAKSAENQDEELEEADDAEAQVVSLDDLESAEGDDDSAEDEELGAIDDDDEMGDLGEDLGDLADIEPDGVDDVEEDDKS